MTFYSCDKQSNKRPTQQVLSNKCDYIGIMHSLLLYFFFFFAFVDNYTFYLTIESSSIEIIRAQIILLYFSLIIYLLLPYISFIIDVWMPHSSNQDIR